MTGEAWERARQLPCAALKLKGLCISARRSGSRTGGSISQKAANSNSRCDSYTNPEKSAFIGASDLTIRETPKEIFGERLAFACTAFLRARLRLALQPRDHRVTGRSRCRIRARIGSSLSPPWTAPTLHWPRPPVEEAAYCAAAAGLRALGRFRLPTARDCRRAERTRCGDCARRPSSEGYIKESRLYQKLTAHDLAEAEAGLMRTSQAVHTSLRLKPSAFAARAIPFGTLPLARPYESAT
jgi:hypothetical protein